MLDLAVTLETSFWKILKRENKVNLIIDTSGQDIRVILLDKDRIYSKCESTSQHQRRLLLLVQDVLNMANCDLSKIDIFCVVVGPGSFTGIRLGVATIKAFNYVFKKAKILPIDMTKLLAYIVSKRKGEEFFVLIKFTSSRSYVGHFDKDGKEIKRCILSNSDIVKIMDTKDKIKFYGFNMQEILGHKLNEIKLKDEDYAIFIQREIKNKNFVSINKLSPLYMSLSQAEELLNKKSNNGNN